MFDNLKNRLKNYSIKKNFTSFTYQGNEDFHTIATLLYPNGIWVKKDKDLYNMYDNTRVYSFSKGAPIYNATIINPSGLYASADILIEDFNSYTDRNIKFDIIEVYNLDTPKEQIIYNMAFKKFVFETSDFEIKKCIVLYVKKLKAGQPAEATKLFVKEDITKQILPVYEKFEKIPFQDIEPLPLRNKTKAKFENDAVYIDYSHRQYWKNKKHYESYSYPYQYKCRAKVGNDPTTKHLISFLHKEDFPLLHINFITGLAKDYDRVYMRNAEFEKAHHREMAKMFPEKRTELYSLNEKIAKWVNYFPIWDKYKPKKSFSLE